MRGIAAVILLLLVPPAAASASAADRRVLVLHDGALSPGSREARVVGTVVDLLGHFECRAAAVSGDDYRAGQLREYDATIYLGLREGAEVREAVLADCYDSERPVCWMGSNLEQLADRFSLGRYGFRLVSEEPPPRPRSVVYRGRHYRRAETAVTEIVVTRPDVCQVLAVAQGNGQAVPYAIRSGSFWYFAELPAVELDEGGSQLILSDQLHEILDERHLEQRQALICITGVSAETEAGPLGTLISYLQRRGVPFAISVVPVSGGREAEEGVPLSSERGLVGLVRGGQAGGASIIGEEVESRLSAGEPGDGGRERLERALAELAKCGLYPVAWVRAGGGRSREEGETEALYSTVLERREQGDGGGDVFPFLVRGEGGSQRVIPDNLTHLREGRGEVAAMLGEARGHAEVPDAWVTASVSPSAPLSAVELLVRGLRQLGYGFADLRSMRNWTEGESLHVHTVAAPRAAGELIPEGWGGTLIDAEGGEETRFERPDGDGREEAEVRPGALLVAYPMGLRPRPILALEGGLQGATNRLVYGIAQIVVFVGVAACGVLLVIYLAQVARQRRA